MNIGSILRLVLSPRVDPATFWGRQVVLDRKGGDEAHAAMDGVAGALGVLDEAGETDDEQVRHLVDSLDLEP